MRRRRSEAQTAPASTDQYDVEVDVEGNGAGEGVDGEGADGLGDTPVTLGQELGGYAAAVSHAADRAREVVVERGLLSVEDAASILDVDAMTRGEMLR